jgi:tetratricopeptide (TPR) repeat protein
MPEYFYTAVDLQGRTITDSVEAESASEAVRRVQDEGCSGIVLHSDDITANLTTISEQARRANSPQELVALGRMRFSCFVLFVLSKHYRALGLLYSLPLLWWAWRRWHGADWSGIDNVLVLLPMLPAFILLLLLFFGNVRKYQRLLQAEVLADWEDVLRRAEATKDFIPVSEYHFRKALALIRLGDVDEGFRCFRKLEFTADIPDWLYWCLLAELHFIANQREQGFAAGAKAVELAPNNTLVLLDFAENLLLHHGDVALAREMLARAQKLPISDMLEHAESAIEGILALESGDAAQARLHLARALDQARIMMGNALWPLTFAKIETYLSLACAGVGDLEAARMHFARIEPLLEAHGKDEWLRRCRAALAREPFERSVKD